MAPRETAKPPPGGSGFMGMTPVGWGRTGGWPAHPRRSYHGGREGRERITRFSARRSKEKAKKRQSGGADFGAGLPRMTGVGGGLRNAHARRALELARRACAGR